MGMIPVIVSSLALYSPLNSCEGMAVSRGILRLGLVSSKIRRECSAEAFLQTLSVAQGKRGEVYLNQGVSVLPLIDKKEDAKIYSECIALLFNLDLSDQKGYKFQPMINVINDYCQIVEKCPNYVGAESALKSIDTCLKGFEEEYQNSESMRKHGFKVYFEPYEDTCKNVRNLMIAVAEVKGCPLNPEW